MGITGLIPFIQKASRQVNIDEFSGCTVAVDSYCWLHKGAFACADKLVRGEETDVYINYCMKYVRMLLSKNIKPILVFDGRHLPAKALTEAKRRESRDISKKRAAELLSLGKIEEARSYMRRSVDITHTMALNLIKECRKRNVDCIVAPYEADAQLAYLNIKNIAHIVITEDSDLILFGCTKVLFKMDVDGTGVLVETVKLPLVMRCPIEHYQFDKFRWMCIMSGCDYLASLPGIGLAKARQFVNATRDSNFANALRKLPNFFNKMSLTVTDEYRENFLKAEATFKHQYVYDPIDRRMVRLTEPDDEDVEEALCVNAGELLAPNIAYQLALGNLDPFTLKKMDDWSPDEKNNVVENLRTNGWKDRISTHASIWRPQFKQYLDKERPWQKKVTKPEPIIAVPLTRPREKIVNLVSKYVPETQDPSLTIESLSSMYCIEPASKKTKTCDIELSDSYSQNVLNKACTETEIIREMPSPRKQKSPILENKERSFRKWSSSSYSVLKRISKFPRTVRDDNIVESKFFNATSDASAVMLNNAVLEPSLETKKIPEIDSQCSEIPDSQSGIEESPKTSKNPFKMKTKDVESEEVLSSSQKENSDESEVKKSPVLGSPIVRAPLSLKFDDEQMFEVNSEVSVIENTYPYEELVTPVDSQASFGESQCINPSKVLSESQPVLSQFKRYNERSNGVNKSKRVVGLKRTASMPNSQQTSLEKYGFQKKPTLKR